MKTKFALFSLFFFAFSFYATAQCGSHAKAVKANYHHSKDIVDVAAGNDQFNTLVAAVKAADLVNTLQGTGPFTVFAPTNSAFDKLPTGTVESLLRPENKQKLTKILTYHVVAGKFEAADVIQAIKNSNGSFTVETVSGDKLTASLSGNTVLLTDENGGKSAVTTTDVSAANGVIHIIDSVILPN